MRTDSAPHDHHASTCASAVSVWGSQNVMSIARYISMAVDNSLRACSCWPLVAYSVPRPCSTRASVMRCLGASMGLPPTQMRWCCSECRTERSPAGAVCTSLHPRQGGMRRHPPHRARGCNSRVYARGSFVVCSRRVGMVAPCDGATPADSEAVRKLFRTVASGSSSFPAVMKRRATAGREPIQHKMNITDL
jgi:hypothetical protein